MTNKMYLPKCFVLFVASLLFVGITENVRADVWDGGTGNFTDMNWDGGNAHPGILDGSNILLNGDVVDILSGTVNSNGNRIRSVGGTFTVNNASLNAVASGNLAGLDFGDLGGGTVGAATGSFSNANVTVSGSGSSGRSLFIRQSSTLDVNGGTLDITHAAIGSNPARATLEIESGGILNVLGAASITTQVLRIDNPGLGLNFTSGNIELNNPHAIRGANAFDGQFNFVGTAGAGTITHTDLTDADVVRHLAGRVTASFFAIDGTTISPTTLYDGSNVADINAELATLIVNGRHLEILEANGTQSLSLVAVPEPATSMVIGLLAGTLLVRRRR